MSNLIHSENTDEDRFEVRFYRHDSQTHKLVKVELAGSFNDLDEAVECLKEYAEENELSQGGGKIRDIEEGKIWRLDYVRDEPFVAFNL